ncbi:MAG: DMT family transporter, partial [Cyanobacteria bacterium P01_D01_bin.73]
MTQRLASISQFFASIPNRVYLLIATLCFAASNPTVRRITDLGADNLVDGRNPISFCNVLFVANLVVLAIILPLYRQQLNTATVSKLTQKDWIALLGVALLAGVIGPAVTFTSLEITSVNNVILIGRLEPPLTLALSVLFLRSRVGFLTVMGSALALLGVALTLLLAPPDSEMTQMMGFTLGRGEILAAIGAISRAIASLAGQYALRQVPLGIFMVSRTVISTIVFGVTATILFGPEHFIDVASPFLWQWMLIYGGVLVMGGQLTWFAGLRSSTASEISLASSFGPIAGIISAFLILGDLPTTAQYIGGSVILLGIVLTQYEQLQNAKREQQKLEPKPEPCPV